jgi:hypothetical protein
MDAPQIAAELHRHRDVVAVVETLQQALQAIFANSRAAETSRRHNNP